MVTLFIACLIGIALGSTLLLVGTQNTSVVRSKAWNESLAMAEAGAEEGLAQLNPGAAVSVDLTANGWGSPSGGLYGPRSGTLSNGTYKVAYTAATFPIIYSTGYVTLPYASSRLARVIRVATTNVPLFNAALAAFTNITMNGNGISADSFDSTKTNLSTNGKYDPSKTSTNGDIAARYGTVNIGNHNIQGDVLLGPSATLVTSGTNQVLGKVYNDFNADFNAVTLPPGAGSWITQLVPLPGVVNGVAYNYVFNSSGDYIIPSMSGSVYVNTNAHVRLQVASGGTDSVKIAGTGAAAGQLTVYMASSSFSIGGNTTIDSGNAANLTYYGLPSNTTIAFSGNATFTGTIYAPSATLTMNGGGNNNYDFVGSAIVKSVTVNGHFMFHWDENLAKASPSRGYIAVAWAEL